MPRNHPNRNAARMRNTRTIAAIQKYFGGVTTLVVDGVTYTPAQLSAVFQGEEDAETKLHTKRAELVAIVRDAVRARAKAHALSKALQAYVRATAGPMALAMLAAFGYSEKRGKKSADVKAEAVDKMRATRKARSTMGKRQRKAVKAPRSA